MYLKSPNGLQETRILNARPRDNNQSVTEHQFMSVHQWGENPEGAWNLSLRNIGERGKIF